MRSVGSARRTRRVPCAQRRLPSTFGWPTIPYNWPNNRDVWTEGGRTALAKEVYKALFGKDGGYPRDRRQYRHLCGEPTVSKVNWAEYIAATAVVYGPHAVRCFIVGQLQCAFGQVELYRRSVRPLQMWFRYCRGKELVWQAWENYGKRYCEAYQIDGGFEQQIPDSVFESEAQVAAFEKWASDKAAGKDLQRKDMPKGYEFRSKGGWWPVNDPFAHKADAIACCMKTYICPTCFVIWPTVNASPAAFMLMRVWLQVGLPRLAGSLRRTDVPGFGAHVGQGQRLHQVERTEEGRRRQGRAAAGVYQCADVDTESPSAFQAPRRSEERAGTDQRASHARLRPSCVLPRLCVAPMHMSHLAKC